MPKPAAVIVTDAILKTSRAPHAEITAGAQQARATLGEDSPDFVVVACQRGQVAAVVDAVERVR
jgi:hypothetical protein